MNSLKTKGIVLSRIEYGEADRIITVLTSDQGKLSLIAKGVRKLKSKLAGGVELFSVNEISFIRGKGEVDTLISARMGENFAHIISDIERVQTGYEILKKINKNTEPDVEGEYFNALKSALAGLDNLSLDPEITRLWFDAQLLNLAGNTPNLTQDSAGKKLLADTNYIFDFDSVSFQQNPNGKYSANDIKILRLFFAAGSPTILLKIKDLNKYIDLAGQVIKYTANSYLA